MLIKELELNEKERTMFMRRVSLIYNSDLEIAHARAKDEMK